VLRDAVNDVLTRSTPGRICLDLNRVMLIDSIGVGILVACFHTAAASGVRLVVSQPSPTVYRQLWISGLVGLFGCAEPPTPRSSLDVTLP
jgi:anti-anti-sigma factor